jgi:hypothetical protein
VEEEGVATDAAAVPDDGRDAHDSAVVKTTCDKAIEKMRAEGVEMVAGLARRVHDSSTLKEKFNTLVSNDKDLPGDKTALDRRVDGIQISHA